MGLFPLGYDHQVAAADAVVDHRVAFHLENVVAAGGATPQQVLRHRQVVDAGHRLDRLAGRDPAVEGHGIRCRTAGTERLLGQLKAALLIPAAPQVFLLPQQLQVLVDGAVGAVTEAAPDLQVGGRHAAHRNELAHEVENLFLPLGQEVVHRPRMVDGNRA